MADPITTQYELYPYPRRDPEDEKKRLITGSPSNWDEVKHYLFSGRWDRAQPFSALIAGGGTGDGAIMLAQQLHDAGLNAKLTYLDVSAPARAIAEARAQVRGLTNITFLSGSIDELANMALGPFDYIDCCGVLMHLADPPAGLRALSAVLEPEGGMGIMVYGTYGRTGVYHLQSALRRLVGTLDPGAQIEITKAVLADLPASNWFKRNPFVGDHKLGDAELTDLLLNARDRSYRVEEVAELADQAGLEIVSFIEPARYRPETYLRDSQAMERAAALEPLARWALAEELAGNMKTHVFYLTRPHRRAHCQAQITPQAIPVYRDLAPKALSNSFKKSLRLSVTFEQLPLGLDFPPGSVELAALIDGQHSLAEISAFMIASKHLADQRAFDELFGIFYEKMHGINHLFLKMAP